MIRALWSWLPCCCAQNELFNQRPIPIIHILPTAGKLTLDLLTQVYHTTQLGVNIRAEDHSTSTHSKVTLNKQLFQGKKGWKCQQKCDHYFTFYYTSSYQTIYQKIYYICRTKALEFEVSQINEAKYSRNLLV